MSFDVYCYKPKINVPDLDDAQSIVENEELNIVYDESCYVEMRQIATYLSEQFPIFESLDLTGHTTESIGLDTNNEEMQIQASLYPYQVVLSVPYWYEGDAAKKVFEKLDEICVSINQKFGYFCYNMQDEIVFDPTKETIDGFERFSAVTKHIQNMPLPVKKSWWKFW